MLSWLTFLMSLIYSKVAREKKARPKMMALLWYSSEALMYNFVDTKTQVLCILVWLCIRLCWIAGFPMHFDSQPFNEIHVHIHLCKTLRFIRWRCLQKPDETLFFPLTNKEHSWLVLVTGSLLLYLAFMFCTNVSGHEACSTAGGVSRCMHSTPGHLLRQVLLKNFNNYAILGGN